MSSTWKYVREARGHLLEVYEQLVGMPRVWEGRYSIITPSDPEIRKAHLADAAAWEEKRLAALMRIVDVLGKYNFKRAIMEWGEQVEEFLHKTPSKRERQKFQDDDTRILFLCVVLWYARVARQWIQDREDEGLLRGGVGYRAMTACAARMGARLVDLDEVNEVLPEESWIPDTLEDDDNRLEAYQRWTYIDVDCF